MTGKEKSIDEQRLELEKKRIEREAKHFNFIEKNEKHSWKSTLYIGLIIALTGVMADFVINRALKTKRSTETEAAQAKAEADTKLSLERNEQRADTISEEANAQLRVFENKSLLEFMELEDIEVREEKLCNIYENGLFSDQLAVGKLTSILSDGQVCFELNKRKAAAQLKNDIKQNCEVEATFVTKSCRAYDKSGFNDRPSASCGISLTAGEGRFFAQDKVEVVSEFYRKRSGNPAIQAIVARPIEGQDYLTSFSGRIACNNSRGTGKTCEAKATVRAKSFPLSCLEIMSQN